MRVYTDQEVAYFNKLAHDYQQYKKRLAIPPYDEIIAEHLAEVRKQIVDCFGADVWVLAGE